MARLEGKVALINSSGPNNGGTIAAMMAKEGARVICNDVSESAARETADHIKKQGGEAVFTVGDAADPDHVKSMVDLGRKEFGYVDTLVNLAGTTYWEKVVDFDLDHWNNEIRTYLTSAAVCMQAVVVPLVEEGRTGSIINIGSDAAYKGQPMRFAYSAVKAGILNMTRSGASELAIKGIRVNAICPTGMEQNLWWRREQIFPKAERTQFQVTRQMVLDAIPMARYGRSSDLGHLAVFLASDESSFITGADIPVDGGATARYNLWLPGLDNKISVEEYFRTKALYQKYGETLYGPGLDPDVIYGPESEA